MNAKTKYSAYQIVKYHFSKLVERGVGIFYQENITTYLIKTIFIFFKLLCLNIQNKKLNFDDDLIIKRRKADLIELEGEQLVQDFLVVYRDCEYLSFLFDIRRVVLNVFFSVFLALFYPNIEPYFVFRGEIMIQLPKMV